MWEEKVFGLMPGLCLFVSPPVCVLSPVSPGLVQRCVVIQRDENGFGLTVSGDNPVFVQSVKEGESKHPPPKPASSLWASWKCVSAAAENSQTPPRWGGKGLSS